MTNVDACFEDSLTKLDEHFDQNFIHSFDHFSLAVSRTQAASRGFAAAPAWAFAGNSIDYYPYSFLNFSS